MVQIFRILMWISCCSILPLEGTGVDESCEDNCSCCKDTKCTTLNYGGFNWTNVCLNGCIDRHRGARCYELCTYDCTSCDGDVNTCDSCVEGFYLGSNKDCTSKCPTNCKTCTSDTECTACKDSHFNKDGSTSCPYTLCSENCECIDNICKTCKNGFFDTGSACYQECPSNCVTCLSRDICNVCKQGFYNGNEFDNCTFKCRESCTECQSYDNCVNCLKGKYGTKCQKNCSIGCKDETCHVKSGNCICLLNFVGDRCTDCANGKYGTYCNEACPEHCKEGGCNKSTGYCSKGCITNTIIGASCDICTVGMHGTFCNKSCPINCKAKACDRPTGDCSGGCKDNVKGLLCDTCIEGKYGVACDLACPLQCEHYQCDKETGKCVNCAGNFDGDSCENCKSGFYGQNCNDICSSHCYNATCGTNTGYCDYGCTENYSGDMCCAPGVHCVKCASKSECKVCDSRYFNYLCDKPCPVNCLNSCDISTGICQDCKMNHFGSFCVRTCPANCKASSSTDARVCTPFDGTCTFGCINGFYGSTCYKSCSNLCIDNVCKQDSGICDKGCDGTNDDQVCVLGKSSLAPGDNSTARTTNIVLATLFALSTTALCILLLGILVRKIRSTERQTEESSFQIPLEHTLVTNPTPQNEIPEEDNPSNEIRNISEGELEHTYHTASASTPELSGEGNPSYEILNISEGVLGHTYHTASASIPEPMIKPGITEYMNLQIPK